MKKLKRVALRGFKTRIAVIGMLMLMTSCGSYESITVKHVNDTSFTTMENDTISAKRRVLFNLQEDASYQMKLEDGKCVSVRSKNKI